jgi:Domain of unknown function (DUF4276)
MNRISIQCIVEGDGEVEALPILLPRLMRRFSPDRLPVTPRPIRRPRNSIVKAGQLEGWVEIAARKVELRGGVLVLLDADRDLPCTLAPTLLKRARTASRECPVSVVLANRNYEAWLIASAATLAGNSGFPLTVPPHPNCEEIRGGKAWLTQWWAGTDYYSPTQHQADLTRLMDIDLARQNSPSFDKLCRDVARLCQEVTDRFGDA